MMKVKYMSIISDTISNLNKVKPNEVLGFKPDSPYDRIGMTKTLGCIWVRQNTPIDILFIMLHKY